MSSEKKPAVCNISFQFMDYLYSEANDIFYKSEKVEDLMDSPLCHYWIASSHNTYVLVFCTFKLQ